MPYYGLYIPVKGGGGGGGSTAANTTNSSSLVASAIGINKDNEAAESPFVFRKKCDALEVLKRHKDARFKEFLNEEEAIKYAQTGFEIVQNKYNDIKTSTASLEKATFRGPTKQELIEFRKIIEAGDCERVKNIIWDNPRYLVSSGDTPTTLKEGYRYNAMHICAISNRPQVAELILKTVSDPKFVDLLTGKKNDEKMCNELAANLLDYYLNIPEKGRSETPLHFAAKMGSPEMIEVLTSYPECKMTPNNEGLLPKQIICSRVTLPNSEVIRRIENLLDERYYVPVIRCNDTAIPGQIGQPFSANNPPDLNCDPLSPDVEIKALAGPMSKEQARQFFRRWKTPPRMGSNVSSPIANNPYISPMKPRNNTPTRTPRGGGTNSSFNSPTATLQRRSLFNSTPQRENHNGIGESNGFDKSLILDESFDDKQNGNHAKESQSDQMAAPKEETNNNHHLFKPTNKPAQMNMLKSALFPRTPLFKLKRDAFSTYRDQNVASPMVGSIDFAHEMNDSLLNVSDVYDSPGYKERHIKNTDTEKGIECIGRELAKEQNVEWREYWDFLEEFVDIASAQGIQKLENYLGQRQRELDQRNNTTKIIQKPDILDDVCSALENAFRNTAAATTNVNVSTNHQSSTPYTYVEKSLQVHARRMTKTIIHNIENVVSINDALLLELRRVKSLIYSFKEDASFINVNFEKVHSRIGNLVSIFLENSQEVSKQMKDNILKILQNLLLTPGERREHIECVCSRIFYMLEHPIEQILPENLKTEEMCSKIWSQEKDCDCQWESNLSRKTSRRNRMEARYKNHQRMKQQEKASKQPEIQELPPNKDAWRNCNMTLDSSDDMEDDVYWSDFGGSDSDEEDVWLTPPESISLLSLIDETENDDGNKIFIYGNEPTKRDLDVLNAIFHIDIDNTKFPYIHSWKSVLMRYPNEEMDYFPSPRVVKKSQSFSAISANKKDNSMAPQTPSFLHRSHSVLRSNTSSLAMNSPRQQQSTTSSSTSTTSTSGFIKEPILQLPTAKRLFMSPGRPKTITANSLVNSTTSEAKLSNTTTTTTNTAANAAPSTQQASSTLNAATLKMQSQQQQHQRPLTPLNKLRGLFSAYRERLDNSPLTTSSTSPSNFLNDCNSPEGSNNNMSLLNISASEYTC